MRIRLFALAGLVVLAGCGSARTVHRGHAPGTPVLRAVYRDGLHHLLVVLPDATHRAPPGDCGAPVLIDDANGSVRQITTAQAGVWLRHMQLAGAVQGTCS